MMPSCRAAGKEGPQAKLTPPGARLCAVEHQAAQAVEDLRLQEPHPSRVQLHDARKRGVCCQDNVVDHACVVAHLCSRHSLYVNYFKRKVVMEPVPVKQTKRRGPGKKLLNTLEGWKHCKAEASHPDVIWAVDRPWTMVPDNAGPGRHKHLALELDQLALPLCSSWVVLLPENSPA